MRKYKKIDLLVSCLLIPGFTISSLIRSDHTYFIGYFVVGGWQLCSMTVHFMNNWFMKKGSRRNLYHWIVLWIFIFTFIGFLFQPLLMIMLFLLLFTAPFMAVYYTWLCYDEIYIKMQRPLALLK